MLQFHSKRLGSLEATLHGESDSCARSPVLPSFSSVMGKPLPDILFHWRLAYQLSNNTLLDALIDCWHLDDAFAVMPYVRPCIESCIQHVYGRF